MRLSLRWKIVGGFGLLLALIVLLASVTFSLFSSIRAVQRSVFDRTIPELIVVDELVRSYTAQSGAVYGFLIGSQAALLDQYRREVATAEVWEERAHELFSGRYEGELIADLVDTGAEFQSLIDEQVVPLAEEGRRAQAFNVLAQDATPLVAEITAVGDLLRQQQDATVAAIDADLRERTNQTLLTLVLVTVGALIMGVFLAVDLPRRLVADLATLVAATRAVGRGEFGQKLRIRSGDEVEELAERFVEMQGGLKRLQQLALQDRELEIAASIQRNLLQRTLPLTPGVVLTPVQRQANLVGGDWYDIALSGDQLTLVVGDASGKGIGAALMATVALSVLRAERRSATSSRTVVARTNKALRDASDPDSFITLVYATLDVRTGLCEWLNMGHPPPFVLRGGRGNGKSVGHFHDGPRNRVLGWFDDPGTATTSVQLEPGDRLLLYTDGLLDAKSPAGEVFGEHRFEQVLLQLASLRSQDLAERVVEEVERFAAGKLEDDLTMVVAEFEGAPMVQIEAEVGETEWRSRK